MQVGNSATNTNIGGINSYYYSRSRKKRSGGSFYQGCFISLKLNCPFGLYLHGMAYFSSKIGFYLDP